MDPKNKYKDLDNPSFETSTPSKIDRGSKLNYKLTPAASLRNRLARDLLPVSATPKKSLLLSGRKQSHVDKDRVSIPPLKLDYLASQVDETPIAPVKQALQTMQSSMNLSLSSGHAITPRTNPDQTDQSLILSPPGVVKEAARVLDSKARQKLESDIRVRHRPGQELQQSSFLLNSSIQKDVDPIEDILEKARKALEEKNQLVASQEEVIRQQKEELDRLEQKLNKNETKLTKRSDDLKIITESIKARLSAQLPPSSPDSLLPGQGDQINAASPSSPNSLLPGKSDKINAATSPISQHSQGAVKIRGIQFSTRKPTQRAILPLSTPTESGLASSPPRVKFTPKANSQPITDSQQTYEIECQRIIGKEKECWLKVTGLELKIILPEDHEFQANRLPHKDFINKFSQDIAIFLKETESEFLNNDPIKQDNILTNFRKKFNCHVLNESNFFKDNDISTRSKPINTDSDILTFCHVLRHQERPVHEPAEASRSNPDYRQPTPSIAPTAMTNLLTVVAKKGLELLRNSSRR